MGLGGQPSFLGHNVVYYNMLEPNIHNEHPT
jgi:hypothetical protein